MSGSFPFDQPAAAAAAAAATADDAANAVAAARSAAYVDALDAHIKSMMAGIFDDIVQHKQKVEQHPLFMRFAVYVVQRGNILSNPRTTPVSWGEVNGATPDKKLSPEEQAEVETWCRPIFTNSTYLLRMFKTFIAARLKTNPHRNPGYSTPRMSNRTPNRRHLRSLPSVDTSINPSNGSESDGDPMDTTPNSNNLLLSANSLKARLKKISEELSVVLVHEDLIIETDDEKEFVRPCCDELLPCSGSSGLMIMASWIKRFKDHAHIPSDIELVRDITLAVREDLESIDRVASMMEEGFRLIKERAHLSFPMAKDCENEILKLVRKHKINNETKKIQSLKTILSNLQHYSNLFCISTMESENNPRVHDDIPFPMIATVRVTLKVTMLRKDAITILRDLKSLDDRVNKLINFMDGEEIELKKVLQEKENFCLALANCPEPSELRMKMFFPTDCALSDKLSRKVDL